VLSEALRRARDDEPITLSLAHLDDDAEDLDREAVVRALDKIGRRRRRKDEGVGKAPRGAAMTGRTAAYGRAAFAWAVKRGAVHTNPFAALPVRKGIAKRERVLSPRSRPSAESPRRKLGA
jgi:hypothetical protein